MADTEIYDLVIVGGGPGGLTAGIYAMRAALKTVVIEKGVAGGQLNNTDSIENWPGTENITGAELAARFSRHAEAYGIETMQREVVAVEPGIELHKVHLYDGEQLSTRTVILATGGSPRKLKIPGETEYYGKGVSYCAVCDGFFYRGKTVVVVGGGDTALEESLYLSKIAKKVHLVHRRKEFRAGMILQKRVLATPQIEVHWNTVLTAIQADESGVVGVAMEDTRTGEKRELATDGVFIFIGFEPNNRLVPAGTRKNADGYVVTDEKCETNNPGIFAIGDLREKYARQIVTAANDGCIAALAAARFAESRKESGPA